MNPFYFVGMVKITNFDGVEEQHVINKYVGMKMQIYIFIKRKRIIGIFNTLTILMSLAIIYRFTI